MIRVVLDANVLAPGLTSRGSAAATILDLWRGRRFDVVVSAHVIAELERTFADPYFAARIPPERAAALVASLVDRAIVTAEEADVRGVATHPEDDAVLAAAVSGGASFLCTRDKQLLRLRSFRNVAIVSPGEYLAILGEEDASNQGG